LNADKSKNKEVKSRQVSGTLKEYLISKYSATSIRSYENMIRRFRLSLGERADGAGYHDVLGYIGQLRG